ncbi:MAG: LPS export ABC transporter ATP-binding protein [Lentisphaerae bacterium]|nr:LPS export ABC transporter ATP-binding protein [Lentisphaerota bacterium]
MSDVNEKTVDWTVVKEDAPNAAANDAGDVQEQGGNGKISANEPLLVSAENLVKTYKGRTVVNQVSLNVRPGEVVGLLGPNGAGKTTSFYMVMGLVRPDGGKVSFRGVDVTRMPMYKRARMGMGYLAQEPSIFRKLTVEENIMAILETLAISRAERKKRCADLLRELDLERLKNQKAMTLSGGERRRLEITRAMVTNPSFIMLDEPFSGVDPIAVHDVQQIILKLKERNLGILITDHNVRETLSVVDRAYIMCMGKVLLEGPSDFLVNDPKAKEIYLGPQFTM